MLSSVCLGWFELKGGVEEVLGLVPLFVVRVVRHVGEDCLIDSARVVA